MSVAGRHIVIVGRDAALWLAACAVRQAFAPAGLTVTAVELPSALSPGSLYGALPPLEALHNKLGIAEATLLRATQGSFTLGWNIAHPDTAALPFFLAHGAYGAPVDGAPFLPYWVKARQFGLNVAFEQFSPTAMAARHGRMLIPDAATEQFGRTDYGYQLPAIAYAALLKARAAHIGVAQHQVHDVAVERDGEDIAALVVAGERIAGDLFIDAGAVGLIDGERESWRDSFPADRMLTARSGRFAATAPYGEWRAGEAGWATLCASRAATHVRYVYSSADQDDVAAEAAAARITGVALDDVVIASLVPDARVRPWTGNCVAIGDVACRFDPLFDVDLHAVQLGIVHLLRLMPPGSECAAERDEYNRILSSSFARMRDFQAAFYRLDGLAKGGFWDRARAGTSSDALAHRIETFRARGDIAPMEDDSFTPDQWQALFVGLGVMPESWPPAIDRTPPDRMKEEFRRILGFVGGKVTEQPMHDAYLRQLCDGAVS